MQKNFISTYHHSFAGGSKNTSRFLHFLSNQGYEINAYFFEMPQYFTYTKSTIQTHLLDIQGNDSEVVALNGTMNYSAANHVLEELTKKPESILFGANLFPYCDILHDAKNQWASMNKNCPKLIIHPVGSDIWQIGTRMKARVKYLLDSPLVDSVLTYSDGFITDIREYYNVQREIHVLPPVLEEKKFFPIAQNEKSKRRKSLGLNDEDFIIHHHSSMRKIKCPEVVLEIIIKCAQLIHDRCVSILTGPIPYDTIRSFNLNLTFLKGNEFFICMTEKDNLTIYWTGIRSDVEYLLQISDAELNASLHDSFNLSLMEAIACGVPVVTSDIVGIAKHILKANAGFCFPTAKLRFDELNRVLQAGTSKSYLFDIDYAVNAIVLIAKERATTSLNRIAGAKYIADEFNFEKAYKEFINHIN